MMKNLCEFHRHQGRPERVPVSQMPGIGTLQQLATLVRFPSPPGRFGEVLQILGREFAGRLRPLQVFKGLRPGVPAQRVAALLYQILGAPRLDNSTRSLPELDQIIDEVRNLMVTPGWVLREATLN